jgi:hypothetical protein
LELAIVTIREKGNAHKVRSAATTRTRTTGVEERCKGKERQRIGGRETLH